MTPPRMHADEVPTDEELVRRLLAAQHPQWSGLPIERVASSGTDNALYRLGGELLVRLPRIEWAVASLERELEWLPLLAPLLPVEIPLPRARGGPSGGYPWPWAVYGWIEGETPRPGRVPTGLAGELARFVDALHAVDLPGGRPGARGEPLALRDEPTRRAIVALEGTVDTNAVVAAWERALAAPVWERPPVWVHGDLSGGNLLLRGGRLAAVIDFGGVGLGDPACDLIVAWNLLPRATRDDFRTEVGVDDATWERGRGWALSVALIQLPYYRGTNPPLAANARHVIAEVLADVGS